MQTETFNFFLPLAKVEKSDDGARVVTGYASTPRLDLDGERVALDAIKKALPSYMEWRAIRQMHQPIAVGVAKEATVDDTGLYVRARVVDPDAIRLLDEEVLKGFSIGGRKLAKSGDTITEIELIEISLVDRPSNPDCRIDTVKAAKDIVLYGDAGKPRDGWLRKAIERLVELIETAADEDSAPRTSPEQPKQGTENMTEPTNTAELEKRASHLHGHLARVSHHLRKAAHAHATGLTHLAKAIAMHHHTHKEAGAGFDHHAALECLGHAQSAFEDAHDHMEMAHAALGKASEGVDLALPDYPGVEHRKSANIEGLMRLELPAATPADTIPRAEAELLAENAALKARLESFSRTPAGVFKGRSLVSQHLVTDGDDSSALALMMKGVDRVDANDPRSVSDATAKMIGNMLANPGRFGRNLRDPSFHGGAGLDR